MDVKVLGAANEVGRSGFLVNCNGTNLLLDYGVMFGRRGTPPEYPLHVRGTSSSGAIAGYVYGDFEVTGDINSANFSSGSASFSGITTFTNTSQNTLGNANTGAVQIDGGLGINKNVTVGGGLSVTGNSYFVGIVTFAAGASGTIQLGDNASDNVEFKADVNSNIIPNAAGFDLGSSSQKWENLYLAGNAGIGSLVVSGISTFIGIATFASGVGIADSIYHIDDSNTSIRFPADNTFTIETNGSERVRVVSDGSVGIGTTIPYKTLDVRGGTYIIGSVGIGTTIPKETLDVRGDTYVSGSVGIGTTFVTPFTTLDVRGDTYVSGSVGIGSTIPSADLDVVGDTQLDSVNVSIAATIKSLSVGTLGQTLVGITTILDEDDLVSDSDTALATQQSIKAYVDTQVTAQDLDFQGDVGGAQNVDLDSQSLTISGTANEIETTGSAQTLTIGLPDAVQITTSLDVPTVEATNLKAKDGTSAITITDGTGNVGIGSTLPITDLDVRGGAIVSDSVGIGTTTVTTDIILDVRGDTYISGSVGIGTTNPEETLDVRGDTYVSGSVGIGTTFTTPFTTLDVRGDTYISGSVGIGSTIPRAPLDVNGDVLVGGGLSVTGNSYFVGMVTFAAGTNGTIQLGDTATDNVVFNADVNSNLIPNTTGAYDLGSSSQKWADLYLAGNAGVGSVHVAGVSTFVGIATFNNGIVIHSGVSTFHTTVDINGNLDVQGNAGLGSVYVSAASTLAGITSFTKEENNTLGTWNSGPVQFYGGVGIRSDVTVGGALTAANIHTNVITGTGITVSGITTTQTLHVGTGGTTLTVDANNATFAIGSATTTVTATMNGGAIPSIGLVIALGG